METRIVPPDIDRYGLEFDVLLFRNAAVVEFDNDLLRQLAQIAMGAGGQEAFRREAVQGQDLLDRLAHAVDAGFELREHGLVDMRNAAEVVKVDLDRSQRGT
jgi:hypothetical protein